ncbi:Thioredoxin-like 4A [Vermiconidia calcicola]|uniref:Thioredoxin-like 4A n=1 Tax=Vermiconidia calcicola TaxID=1690605 RepID=A0ACC3NT80_9PEZI|nr:Thioredoxin-like 4A [Vermiconidia calcicola]
MGSVVIPHLVTGWHVDQAIMSEEDRLVVIRFGRDWDPDCMRQDEVLYKIADRVKNFAVIYVCDLDQVPDFKQMYELYDTVTMMFFFRNKHMMCDFGTGNNNKLNWVLEDKQELIDIIETIYKGAKKGRGLVRWVERRYGFDVLDLENAFERVDDTRGPREHGMRPMLMMESLESVKG